MKSECSKKPEIVFLVIISASNAQCWPDPTEFRSAFDTKAVPDEPERAPQLRFVIITFFHIITQTTHPNPKVAPDADLIIEK